MRTKPCPLSLSLSLIHWTRAKRLSIEKMKFYKVTVTSSSIINNLNKSQKIIYTQKRFDQNVDENL